MLDDKLLSDPALISRISLSDNAKSASGGQMVPFLANILFRACGDNYRETAKTG